MPFWQSVVAALEWIHKVIGPLADMADLHRLFENAGNAIKKLPLDMQAKVRKGDAFREFRDAMSELELHEREAVRELLARLRTDQAKQEHFILKAAAQGGLDNPEGSKKFLKDLATMSTDEALLYLEDVDATQPSVTLTAAKNSVTKTAEVLGDAAKAVGSAIKKGEAAVSADIDNSGLSKILDNSIADLEKKLGIKP
ncbi:MAG: hypothetical protein HY336_01540 [Candidatus Doudnabacteria bacterium]|nr:hypothetical protein [Candidatus Doudnabacteria bacterium]